MPTSIRIDENSGMATLKCSGVLQLEDAMDSARKLWATPNWPGESAVWDFRTAEFDLSPSDVRQIAEFILAHQPEAAPGRMAFVVSRNVDFGMSRMFEVYREDSRTSFQVFRDFEEAASWAQPTGQLDA